LLGFTVTTHANWSGRELFLLKSPCCQWSHCSCEEWICC